MEVNDVENRTETIGVMLQSELSENENESEENNEIIIIHNDENGNSNWLSEIRTIQEGNYIVKNEYGDGDTLEIETVEQQETISVVAEECDLPSEELDEPIKKLKKNIRSRKKKNKDSVEEKVGIENSVQEVREHFQLGCECQDVSCFNGLNPESVYKHRLNIAELTKEEHDMYLMGLTMACINEPGTTGTKKEKLRMRSHYCYHGRKVCRSAFLYLENCTIYQLKCIRKHLKIHGVMPRVHGNHGRKPHNVFSLGIYQRATAFLKSFIEKHTTFGGNSKTPVTMPCEITRKMIHREYEEYVKSNAPSGEKIIGYGTFLNFLKEQFPHVKFQKLEPGSFISPANLSSSIKSHQSGSQHPLSSKPEIEEDESEETIDYGADGGGSLEVTEASPYAAIPVVISTSCLKQDLVPTAYIMAPVQQIFQTPAVEFMAVHPQTVTVASGFNLTPF